MTDNDGAKDDGTNGTPKEATKPVKPSRLKEYVLFGSILVVVIGSICVVLGGQMQGILAARFAPVFMKQATLTIKELPAGSGLYAARDIAKSTVITRDDIGGISRLPQDKPPAGTPLPFAKLDGKPAKQDIHTGDYFTSENAGD